MSTTKHNEVSKPVSFPSRLCMSTLNLRLGICRFDNGEQLPDWAIRSTDFLSITRTADELSIVCEEDSIPPGIKAEKGWRAIKVEGPLDFKMTGVLSSILSPLADAKISIFAVSTYETDYILVKSDRIDEARRVLERTFDLSN